MKPIPGVTSDDREADTFATHLIMPSSMIREQLGKLVHGKTYAEPGDIIGELSRTFDVEPWRMTARLIEMQLLEGGIIRGDKV